MNYTRLKMKHFLPASTFPDIFACAITTVGLKIDKYKARRCLILFTLSIICSTIFWGITDSIILLFSYIIKKIYI